VSEARAAEDAADLTNRRDVMSMNNFMPLRGGECQMRGGRGTRSGAKRRGRTHAEARGSRRGERNWKPET
jgi:hypothetical protein